MHYYEFELRPTAYIKLNPQMCHFTYIFFLHTFFQSVVSWQMLHLIRATSLHTEPHVTDSTDTWNRLPYLGWCFSVIILMHFGLIVIVKHLHLPQFTYSYTFD